MLQDGYDEMDRTEMDQYHEETSEEEESDNEDESATFTQTQSFQEQAEAFGTQVDNGASI